MFKELTTLLRKGDTIALTIGRENDTQFRVNVMPKLFTLDGEKGTDRKALNTPLSMLATAEELDSPQFVETLNRFTTSTQDLRHTIDDVEKAHKAAAESKKNSPAPKGTGGTLPPHKARKVKSDKSRKATNAALAVPASVAGEKAEEPAKPATAEAATVALI